MTATTVLVAHSFQVITQTEVASVIREKDLHPFLLCSVNGATESKFWGKMQVGLLPRVLSDSLLQPTFDSSLGWIRGRGQGPHEHWGFPWGRDMRRECPRYCNAL